MSDEEDVPTFQKKGEVVLRVANTTEVHRLGYAVQKNMEEGSRVIISCVGMTTLNLAVKAIALVNGKVAIQGYVFLLLPTLHAEADPRNLDVEHSVLRLVVMKHLIGG